MATPLRLSSGKRIGYAIAVLVVVALLLAVPRGKSVPAQFHVLKPQTAFESVLANGRVAGSAVIPLAFQRSGAIARIAAREGASVRMHDTLVALDNREERNAVAQRRTAVETARLQLERTSTTDSTQAAEQVAQARAQEDLLARQLERQKALAGQNAVAQSELDRAQRDYDVAVSQRKVAESVLAAISGTSRQLGRAQVAESQAALESAQIALARTFIFAPEDGKVVNRFMEVGQIASPGAAVLDLLPADTTTHVEVLVDESEMGRIRVGQKALVALVSHPDTSFEAAVRDIIPSIDATRGTVTVQLAVGRTGALFIADQTVTAQIVVGEIPGALTAPQRFVAFAKDSAGVFVLRGKKARRAAVTVRDMGTGSVLVEKGLAAGDTVLSAPGLKEGARVKLIP